MKELTHDPLVERALDCIHRDDGRTVEQQLELVQIPAPSHQEERKARRCLELLREAGLEQVRMDEVWNVFGTLPGRGDGPRVILAAHTDTVFPIDTDVRLKRDGERYCCPGINDDTRGVAELLSIARAMVDTGLRGDGDIVFCANVCEEGLGDLKGVKHIFREPGACDAFVSIDNPVTGGIVYTATGSLRYRVTFRGGGGHSFADFGIPNPIHAMGRAMAIISDFQVPGIPKTTFNVGVIEGGTSVNTISASASMLVDIRSDSGEELRRLSDALGVAVRCAVEQENGRWTGGKPVVADLDLLGRRPAGTQPEDCAIVRAAWDAALALGIQPELRDESSTDANIPISMGIPAITVGRGGEEGGVHTVHEWFVPRQAWLAPQRTLLLLLALTGYGNFQSYLTEKN